MKKKNKVSNTNAKDFFYTIEKESFVELKDRGSRFLAYAFPVNNKDEFRMRLNQLKEEHPKAVHHCFAYRIGTDGNHFRSSDDGEPSGSAGRTILRQMDTKELTNAAIIVVRYFGGTLLGVPGLTNAYKTAASFSIQLTAVVKKPVLIIYRLHFDYSILNEVMMVIKKYNCIVLKQDMQLFCLMETGIPKANLGDCLLKLKNYPNVEISLI